MEYNVLINIGLVKRGLFSSAAPEFNSSILPYAAISCFSDSSDYKVSRSTFSCLISTDMTSLQAAKALADKMAELTPEYQFKISAKESNGAAIANIGEKSSISVYESDSDAPEVEQDEEETQDEDSNDSEADKSSYDQKALDRLAKYNLENLIGWDSYKQYFTDVAKIAPKLNEKKTIELFKSQCYLLSINDGCGITKAINDLTLLGNYVGAYDVSRYYEYVLGTETVGRKISMKDVIPYFKNSDNEGMLICLDISEFTGKTTQAELKDLLFEIAQHVTKMNFVFRVPYLEPKELKRIEDFISDILLLKTFVIPPYTDSQLKQFAEMFLKEYNFSMDEEAVELFYAKIREEKSDGCFYGIRTVKKVIDQFILEKHKKNAEAIDEALKNKQATPKESYVICKEDIESLVKMPKGDEKDPYAELYQMVGMEKIAERVKEIVSQVKVALANDKLDKPCMHMRFLGAPGTGKTTVARIIGKIFAENGILTNGHFFEYSGRDLCGRYVGQTAPKTLSICRDAYGSVLFLDEAYELYTSDNNENDYGHEALATLIAEMENHRDNFVVIMAGYKGPMETLMKGNVGLRSRMPFAIEFPSYNREQLVAIFMKMLQKHFEYEEGIEESVKNFFDGLSDKYLSSEEFSNARYVRNLYERTWSKAAMRTQMDGTSEIKVSKADFEQASQEEEFKERVAAARNRVGY